MQVVYILRSKISKEKLYIGTTISLEVRLKEHNQGRVAYSKKYRPWDVEAALSFKHKSVAFAFEKYLKSGSGCAFLKKRFLP